MRSADRGERLKEKVCEAKTKKEIDCFNQLQLQLHMSSGDYDKVVITNILNKNHLRPHFRSTAVTIKCAVKLQLLRQQYFKKYVHLYKNTI